MVDRLEQEIDTCKQARSHLTALQVDAWRPLQASHRLQGPISLRRNWNHRFLTLERKYSSDWRRTCGVVLLKKLTSSMQLSAMSREHLEESQATGSQPREGDLSLIEGSNMMLAEMYANEVWAWT